MGGITNFCYRKKFLTLLLGGRLRVFGVKLLNRVYKQIFFPTTPWSKCHKITKIEILMFLTYDAKPIKLKQSINSYLLFFFKIEVYSLYFLNTVIREVKIGIFVM